MTTPLWVLLWLVTSSVTFGLIIYLTRPSTTKKLSIHWGWLVGLLVVLVGLGIWWFNREPKEEESTSSTIYISPSTPAPEFPVSGDGYATKEEGLKAYLDPNRTKTRSRHPETRLHAGARYVFAEDPTITFNDLPGDNINHGDWLKKPAGEYLVYPLKGVEKIHFRWWQ